MAATGKCTKALAPLGHSVLTSTNYTVANAGTRIHSTATGLAFTGYGKGDGNGHVCLPKNRSRTKNNHHRKRFGKCKRGKSLSTVQNGVDSLEVALKLMLLRKHPSQLCAELLLTFFCRDVISCLIS